MLFRLLKRSLYFLLVLAILGAAAAGAALYWLVVVEPGPEIELANIEKTLGRESPVFFRDGNEKVGVLFQDAHRQYLPYHKIPKDFVNAIIAAEDARFFDHSGVDIMGITRAMIANIRAGRVVQGGSTITQQTAKNLFKRESRTIKAKLKELLYALRLEYHYSKEKILEFYVNQFFVSGNGHGLGVAARYYFDKEAEDLTLLECAFIAGSVKRPNYYNPFTKSTGDAADRARQRAETRAAYVLANMKRLGFISPAEYSRARTRDIIFRRGRMSYALNTIMDLVRDGLSAPVVTAALDRHGIGNVATSGIKIYTTVDRGLQDATLAALRRELSRLDVRLRGYARDEVRSEYARLDYPGDTLLRPGSFVFGRIVSVTADDDEEGVRIRVRLNRFRREGVIDAKGLGRILTAFARHRKNRWSVADDKDRAALLSQLQAGDLIYVSVREDDGAGDLVLELERFPQLQGAALVMREGAVLAMAGGMENRYFNRAVDARRPMGSIFKPFLFAAALQLGWSATDLLRNYRDVFVFQDRPYFPRPDHHSPFSEVSMSWAGVKSENLAAVWLLYHLTDHLTPPRLRELAAYLDLAPRTGNSPESYGHFKRRIRDRYGVSVNRDMLLQASYDRAVRNLEADFLFEGRGDEYVLLRRLPYGLHFDRYAEGLAGPGEDFAKMSGSEKKEMELRQAILAKNFLALRQGLEDFDRYRIHLERDERSGRGIDALFVLDRESGNVEDVGALWEDGQGRVVFSRQPAHESWRLLSDAQVRERLAALNPEELETFWDEVIIEGYISAYALRQVAAQMAVEKAGLFSRKPYSMEVLSSVRDYRILVGLQYLIRLASVSGIKSRLEPVLSFPLGSNVITLMDAVRMYETLVSGTAFRTRGLEMTGEETAGEGLAIIDRIETVDGEVIYSRKVDRLSPFDPSTAAAVTNVLENTVRYGTGAYARTFVRLHSTDPARRKFLDKLNLPLPLLGKTGTANQFRNAAFLGYVPSVAVEETGMVPSGGYSVGVYVGFDDNRPMEKGTTHVTGSAGALPTWSEIAESALNLDRPGDRLDLADLSFNGLPLRYPDVGQLFVPVDSKKGGTIIPGRAAMRTNVSPSVPAVLAFGRVNSVGNFEPDRFFRPFWTGFRDQVDPASR